MLKGWKTLLFAAATSLLGVAATMDWTSVVNSQTAGYIITGIGLVTGALRFLTNSPVGSKA